MTIVRTTGTQAGRPAGYFFRYRWSPSETTFRPDRPPVGGTSYGTRGVTLGEESDSVLGSSPAYPRKDLW